MSKSIDVERLIEDYENEPTPEVAYLLHQLAGTGGDIKFKDHWYPQWLEHEDNILDNIETEIRDAYSVQLDALPSVIADNIRWEEVSRQCLDDYSIVTWDGETYYYRN